MVTVTEKVDGVCQDVVYEDGFAFHIEDDNAVAILDEDGVLFAYYPPGTYTKVVAKKPVADEA